MDDAGNHREECFLKYDMLNNLVLTYKFKEHNLAFCSLFMISEICVFC